MEGNNANHYTSHAEDTGLGGGCRPQFCWAKMFLHCILRGSNPRGLCPLGLKSSALTTRPRMRVRNTRCTTDGTQKGCCSQSETRTHNLPVNSRARCRLRHPGTCVLEAVIAKKKKRLFLTVGCAVLVVHVARTQNRAIAKLRRCFRLRRSVWRLRGTVGDPHDRLSERAETTRVDAKTATTNAVT